MSQTTSATISSVDDFKDNPAGQQERWDAEMEASHKETEKWHKEAQRIVDRYLDVRPGTSAKGTRLNVFTSTVQTLRAMMYGGLPGIDVKRRYDDPDDDVGRVAATMMERLLTNDVEREDDRYEDALRYALDDRLTVGLGVGRVRYEAQFETEEVPAILQDGIEVAPAYELESKTWEDAVVDYVNWRDVRWSPARVWGEVRWIGFRAYLTKDQVKARFGAEASRAVPYGSTRRSATYSKVDALQYDAWQRCEVWEIWSKENREVYWYVKGYNKILDSKPDPLELDGFYPCPKFLLANATTSSLVPRSDFTINRDLYNEIDYVSTRITSLERAIKAVGVYDKSAEGVKRMLQEGFDNDLLPVDNWAQFAEKGGLEGAIQWNPIEAFVQALDTLRSYRKELIDLLYQTTGLSDILRGESSQPNVTATEQGIKAHYASVRVTALQDQFADFATALQQLRSEIIVKHFDDQTIIERSTIMQTKDKELVPEALKLLRSQFGNLRVEILSDDIARADWSVTKGERMDYLTAVGTFIQSAMPMMETTPAAGPILVQMLQWATAGFRGGQGMESVLDKALQQMMAAQKQQQGQPKKDQQPNPAEAEKIKQQTEMMKAKARAQEQQMKAQAAMMQIRMKAEADMASIQAELQSALLQQQAESQGQVQTEGAQSMFNVAEEEQKAEIAVAEHMAKLKATQQMGPSTRQ